jgi:hypothetical protein
MPVLVDVGGAFPGRPVPLWPAAASGEAFTPPTRRGVPSLFNDALSGRFPACGRALPRRLDGVSSRMRLARAARAHWATPGRGYSAHLWLPLFAGLTLHGLRHGNTT